MSSCACSACWCRKEEDHPDVIVAIHLRELSVAIFGGDPAEVKDGLAVVATSSQQRRSREGQGEHQQVVLPHVVLALTEGVCDAAPEVPRENQEIELLAKKKEL